MVSVVPGMVGVVPSMVGVLPTVVGVVVWVVWVVASADRGRAGNAKASGGHALRWRDPVEVGPGRAWVGCTLV